MTKVDCEMLEEIKSAVSFIRILWFYNVGDEAILQSIIKALHEEDPTLELVVLSNDPDYTRKMYGVEAVNRWDIRAIYKEIKRSNGLISGEASFKIKRVLKVFCTIQALCELLVFEEAVLYLCARNWSNYEKTKSFISEMASIKSRIYISS